MSQLVSYQDIGGSVIRDDERYVLRDNAHLAGMVLSRTELKPGQETRGHAHEGLDEIYIFDSGTGKMEVGDKTFEVTEGSVVLITAGDFHRVYNLNADIPLVFTCIFQKYDR